MGGRVVDGGCKGLPPGLPPTPLTALGTFGWSLLGDDLPTPVAILRDDALAHNCLWMARFIAQTGAAFAPHVKTTMSPELMRLQLEDGAWGLTVANVHQAAVALEVGAARILIANQVISGPELAWLTTASTRAEIFTLVDSVAAVARLSALNTSIRVLVEVGYPGGRAGCRTAADALAVARAVRAAPGVELAGIEAYEGLIAGADPSAREARVGAFLDEVVVVAEACRGEGLLGESPLLTAGGTTFPDLVARRFGALAGFTPILRSGCYLTGDHGIYAAAMDRLTTRAPDLAGAGLLPALEVWATVLSRPEPMRVVLGAGKRDLGIDAGAPVPLRAARPGEGTFPCAGTVVEVNDQHAHLVVTETSTLRVGDRVALGITHPCTTFDRWSVILRVDAAWRVTGAVHTRFG